MTVSERWKWTGMVTITLVATLFIVVPSGRTDLRECPGKYLTREEARDLALQQHARACECSDRAAIQQRIQDAQTEQQQIQQLETNGSGQDLNKQLAEATGKSNIVGRIEYRGPNQDACTPVVCDSAVKQCTTLWLATFAHEEGHCNYFDSLSLLTLAEAKLLARLGLSDKAKAVFQAESEIAARQNEVAYLRAQLDALNKKCPKPARYPGLDDDSADQIRLAGAARRVGSYANTI
jgi:Tfp pilus assembly protein PilN